MRPNVLLLVLDAARADHFEPYGAPVGSTPVVADLARAGSYVPLAYAAGSWTVPSHTALFSGLLPRAAGLSRVSDSAPQSCRLRMEALRSRLLPEVLRQNGYETRALSTNAWLTPGSGFETGFDRFELVNPSRDMRFGSNGRRNAARAGWEAFRADVDDGAREAGEVLRTWMGEPRNRPFFWFVNLVEAHSPYLPPKPFNDLGPRQRVQAAIEARRYLSMNAIWRASLGQLEVPEGVLARMRRLYAASIRSLDAWLGEVLEALESTSLLQDTLVVVTADHGENLGESGMMGHSFSLDERLLRVPLVTSGPVELAGDELISLASVPSHLGRALELPDHPWEDPLPSGVAVAQFDPPTAPGDPRNEQLPKRWGIEDADGEFTRSFTTELSCATDGQIKLLRHGEREDLYDLRTDPLEERPVAPNEHPSAIVERLRVALDRADAATAEISSPDHEPPIAPSAEDIEDLEERMRLLGYL